MHIMWIGGVQVVGGEYIMRREESFLYTAGVLLFLGMFQNYPGILFISAKSYFYW